VKKKCFASLLFIVPPTLAGCASTHQADPASEPGTYRVARLRSPITIDAKWDKPAWRNVRPIELTHFMGKRPEHFPHTQAKLAYDDKYLYAIYRVEDQYVRAVAPHHQGDICHDSCVEFFFAPSGNIVEGYFNLEMNCGGTMLFNFQLIPWKDMIPIKEASMQRITVGHTLPPRIDPEIVQPTVWTLEYRLPVDVLTEYCPAARKPAPGVTWRGNIYKCADKTSHPHWLTWAEVKNPVPNFHMPEYFGTLIFE